MVVEARSDCDPPKSPVRVPASTIRRLRLLHGLRQEGLAACFQVSERTVIRWEERGIDPARLEPKWRKDLLFWMLERLQRAGSPDNRKQQGAP